MHKYTIQLGDLINALYDVAQNETADQETASQLVALSTIDLLLHNDNERIAALLLTS
jgi:hypothetical protein